MRFKIFAGFLICLFIFCSCGETVQTYKEQSLEQTSVLSSLPKETTAAEPKNTPPCVKAVFAGDNLIHKEIYEQAKTGDGYNFDYAYSHVEKLIKGADLAVINQETPIAGEFQPSSYPLFNSPPQLGEKVISIGFNAVSHANNHILDKGEAGLLSTIGFWKDRGILVYGAYRNDEELEAIPTMNINGIVFSFVGFMEHTNGLKLPEGSKAKLVYTSQRDEMKRLIEKADEVSDAVIVSVHWGVEISNTVTNEQRELAKDFASWGADIIIGTQPHTIQTMEYIQGKNSRGFVAYSLGNFISAQDSSPLAMIGEVLSLEVEKESDGIKIKNPKAHPLVTHYEKGKSGVTVYPYEEYTSELAAKHGMNSQCKFNMDFINKIIDENIPLEVRD